MPPVTREQLVKRLREMAKEVGSQAALANRFGVSPSYLAEILKGTREPGKKVLAALGLEKQVQFKPKSEAA